MLLLWNMVKRFFDEDWTAGVFLAANVFLWTALSCVSQTVIDFPSRLC